LAVSLQLIKIAYQSSFGTKARSALIIKLIADQGKDVFFGI